MRDRRSLEFAQQVLGVEAFLCPDLAFALGPLPRPRDAEVDVVWILRADSEAGARDADLGQEEPRGWTEDPRGGLARVQRRLTRRVARSPSKHRLLAGLLRRTGVPMAERRLRRGLDLLARGRAVVTDRLHGHILCLLLGIPHVVLDNSYGKVRRFREAWTDDDALGLWSSGDPDEVRELVEGLLQRESHGVP